MYVFGFTIRLLQQVNNEFCFILVASPRLVDVQYLACHLGLPGFGPRPIDLIFSRHVLYFRIDTLYPHTVKQVES